MKRMHAMHPKGEAGGRRSLWKGTASWPSRISWLAVQSIHWQPHRVTTFAERWSEHTTLQVLLTWKRSQRSPVAVAAAMVGALSGSHAEPCMCTACSAPPPPPTHTFLHPLCPPRPHVKLCTPPTQWVDNQPSYPQLENSLIKGEHVRTPRSITRHTHSAFMAPAPLPPCLQVHFMEILLPLARKKGKVKFSDEAIRQQEVMWREVLPELGTLPALRYRHRRITADQYFAASYIAAAYRRREAMRELKRLKQEKGERAQET